MSDFIVCLFSSDPQDEPLQLKQLGNRLLMDWERESSQPLSIVLFEARSTHMTLNEKYLLAKQALDIRFFKGSRQVPVVDGPVDWVIIDPFLTPAEQRAWIDMLHDGDREQIKEWMYRQFLHQEAPYPEPGLLRTRLTSILAQVRRFMKSHRLDEGALENQYNRVFETILDNPILYRIVQEFLLFIYDLLDQAKNNRESYRVDAVEQAIRYMEENFHNSELKLEDVAGFVGRSPAYLSSLLTKKQGISFRQLLTSIRVKQAQRLLRETTLSVQEIADKAGFHSANYFNKIFKEKTGTTPRRYRNLKK